MQAIVLIILYQGQETLAVYDTDSAAWDALLEFVDQRWQGRFGHIPRPDNNDERVETFFSGEDVYRSEEHTSELQSLMRSSYAVFCLKKKKPRHRQITQTLIRETTQQIQ